MQQLSSDIGSLQAAADAAFIGKQYSPQSKWASDGHDPASAGSAGVPGARRIGFVWGGNALVPLGLKLPVDMLPPGSYRLELKAVDSAGNTSQPRTADFEVQ